MKLRIDDEGNLMVDENLVNEVASKIANNNVSLDSDFTDQALAWKKDSNCLRKMRHIWDSNGVVNGQKFSIDSLMEKDRELTSKFRGNDNFSQDHPLLLPRVVSEIAREAIEPQQVLTPLMSRVNFQAGTRIVFPSWGAIHAADIAEGGEYPERSMEVAGQVEAIIGKSGVAIKVTEEMIRYSAYDVLSMHIRAAGRALSRLKEEKVAALITADRGNVIFDNDSTAYRSTTGRDPGGTYNGTMVLDDLFHAYAVMVDRGFPANTLIMHPLAWQIFAQEGIARAFGFINGVNPLMWQAAQGSPGNANPWRAGGLNQNTYVSSPGNIASTFTNVPSIFPSNFRVVVSPYMPYNATNNTTDIIFCDASELGILVVDEDVTTDEWMDHARDMRKIKFRERYGLAVMNDGKGIGLLKNIVIGKGFDFADRLSVNIDATGLGNSLTGDANLMSDVIS